MQNNQNPIDNKENKRTVRIFTWASFLNDMGSDIIYPVWPLFVTEILKANMAVLGFVDGLPCWSTLPYMYFLNLSSVSASVMPLIASSAALSSGVAFPP